VLGDDDEDRWPLLVGAVEAERVLLIGLVVERERGPTSTAAGGAVTDEHPAGEGEQAGRLEDEERDMGRGQVPGDCRVERKRETREDRRDEQDGCEQEEQGRERWLGLRGERDGRERELRTAVKTRLRHR
jgi:hypothetical protein